MEKLKSLIEEMFDHAQLMDAGSPGIRSTKRHLQQMAGELGFTGLALKLRGKLAGTGEAAGKTGSGALVQTGRPGGRFNTQPPANIFVDPTKSSQNNAEVAATNDEEDDENAAADGAKQIYDKIVKMSPTNIVSTYGESAIMSMISKLGGEIEADKSPNQKAAYLKSLIKSSEE